MKKPRFYFDNLPKQKPPILFVSPEQYDLIEASGLLPKFENNKKFKHD